MGSNAFYAMHENTAMNDAKSAMQETESHLEVFFYRVPKKNRAAIEENLNKFRPWFKNQGVGLEYYRLGDYYKPMEGMEGLAETLSASKDEDIWAELQHFRDFKHREQVYAVMMQDKSIEQLGNEFFGLITQGKSLVTGGFDRLRA